jgi:Zn-dependent protease
MVNNLIVLLVRAGLIAAIFYSIILHEVSHGLTAYWLGDDTAKRNGRLSLNPLKHIDWFGTVILPVVLYITTGFAFGYAKPVPINPYNFQNYKRDTGLTAAAGPLTNVLIAIFFALIFHLSGSQSILGYLCVPVIQINLFLALFNLIPFPPLDGSKVLGIFLSDEAYFKYTAQERTGLIVFFAVILISNFMHLNLFGRFIWPIINSLTALLGIPT